MKLCVIDDHLLDSFKARESFRDEWPNTRVANDVITRSVNDMVTDRIRTAADDIYIIACATCEIVGALASFNDVVVSARDDPVITFTTAERLWL